MVFLRIWTDEKIISQLKLISLGYGKINNKILIKVAKEKNICNPSLIRQRFGSLEIACKKADVIFENNKGKSYWTKEKIYKVGEQLSSIYKKLNKEMLYNLYKSGVICNPTHISKRVGNIKDFFASVGIEYTIKSYKDIFGEKYATIKIEKFKKSNTKYSKEKIINMLKDIYKENKNLKIKDLDKYSKLGKIASNNIIRKYFGTYRNLFDEANIPFIDYYWPKERIIKQLKFLNKKYGPLARCEINHIFAPKGLICKVKCIRDVCGSLEKAAKIANIEFVEAQEKGYTNGKVGKKETQLLNEIEGKKDIKLIRQFRVEVGHTVYFIDGYDSINNIAYEIDDRTHKYTKQQYLDKIRETEIQNILNCDFERIKDY